MAVRTPWRVNPRRSPGELEREEDRSLARLAAEGDEEAFAAIFERHHRGVLILSRHMLGSREEAEDALQHTFAAAYRQLVEKGPPDHMRAWLYATARNRCSSVLRARRELPHGEVPATTAWLPDEVERRSDLRELLDDIVRLPEEQRVALVLAEIEELDHSEIAQVLGCRRDKVRALVFQARSTLGGWREARATPCREVREEIAVARGPDLRRAYLSRHLAVCPDCTAFRADVDEQRRRVALLLPPLPIALALKEGVVEAAIAGTTGGAAAAGGAAAGGGGAAAGGAAAGGGIATAVKVGAAALVIGGAGVAGFGSFGGGGEGSPDPPQANSAPAPEQPQPAESAAPSTGGQTTAKKKKKTKTEKRLKAREQTQQAGATESVEQPATAAAASSAGTTSATPAVPVTPSTPAVPATPQPPPVPEAPIEVAPEAPAVETPDEIQAVPQELVP
jgi:RNA polymerase sigma factor (sigma-70 family)